MPWHDETPWAEKRRREQCEKQAIAGRVDRIEHLVKQVRRGEVSERKALFEIEEIARGGADAIVRVGNQHVPDIQTTREEE